MEKRSALLIVSCIFVVSLSCLGLYALSIRSEEKNYENLALGLHTAKAVSTPAAAETDETAAPPSSTSPAVLSQYAAFYAKNSDLVAWLTIDGTSIDYPVMRIEGDNDFYLQHDFYKKQSSLGTPFVDYHCTLWPRSTNLIVYGHHIRGGKMFSALLKYENDPAYCAAHSIIHFNTIYEEQDYQVMAVFRSQIYRSDETIFKFYNFVDAKNEEEFDTFVQNILALSQYDTGIRAKYGDSFLTLVTCAYHVTNGRFVIVAKRID